MSALSKIFSKESEWNLTPEQRHMYATESFMNFRLIARLCATPSPYTLGLSDLAQGEDELYANLAEIGQFVFVSFSTPPPDFIFANLDQLVQPDFPFEGFDALRDAELVSELSGSVANTTGAVVYRKSTKQLVVSFGGTTNLKQAWYDLYAVRCAYPRRRACGVHCGFWKMYEGCQKHVFDVVKKALENYDVQEVVSLGHSLGGALAYLFALDALSGEFPLPSGVGMMVATFGCPRVGDAALSEYWQDLVRTHQAENGVDSVKEFQVKTLNDGVPSLPPVSWGYRHLTRKPLYLHHGRLFHIPESECEHGAFTIAQVALDPTRTAVHPKGGHNYYIGKDAEKIVRRLNWMMRLSKGKQTSDWVDTYLAKIHEVERAWQKCEGTQRSDRGE